MSSAQVRLVRIINRTKLTRSCDFRQRNSASVSSIWHNTLQRWFQSTGVQRAKRRPNLAYSDTPTFISNLRSRSSPRRVLLYHSSVVSRAAKPNTMSTPPDAVEAAATTTLAPPSSPSASIDIGERRRRRVAASAGKTPTWQYYLRLTKPRLGLMVLLTAMGGFVAAPTALSGTAYWTVLMWSSVGTAFTIASANSINQWMEIEFDREMVRTMARSLPAERVTPRNALLFGVSCGVLGTAMLYATTPALSCALAAGNILLYTCVYTPTKRVHWYNTWVGAIVGAVPPLIGWAAATGGTLHAGAYALALVLFVWQIPHFLALAWTYRSDYERAGYQMLSNKRAHVIQPTIFLWSLYHVPLGYVCVRCGLADAWFAYTSLPISFYLLYHANRFLRHRTTSNSRALFRATLLWLPAFFAILIAHQLVARFADAWALASV